MIGSSASTKSAFTTSQPEKPSNMSVILTLTHTSCRGGSTSEVHFDANQFHESIYTAWSTFTTQLVLACMSPRQLVDGFK